MQREGVGPIGTVGVSKGICKGKMSGQLVLGGRGGSKGMCIGKV